MKVSEAIKLLESKVLRSEENLKYFPKESQGYAANEARIIAYNIAINKLEQIDEPQPAKVEVPSCMGIFLDRYPDKEETSMHIIMHDFTKSEYFSEFAEIPLADYPMGWDRLMASALMFGYTVKPKRWVVKFNDAETDFYFMGWSDIYKTDDNPFVPNGYAEKDKGRVFIFTNRAKAEAVATLVEGTVEEV